MNFTSTSKYISSFFNSDLFIHLKLWKEKQKQFILFNSTDQTKYGGGSCDCGGDGGDTLLQFT